VRRVAWFCVVIDTDDEEVANRWLTTVATAMDRFAREAADICSDKLSVVETDAGQSIPVDQQPDV
jgi:hypothetical protein